MRSFEIRIFFLRLRTLFHWWVPRWDPHADLKPEVGGLGETVKVVHGSPQQQQKTGGINETMRHYR